MGNKDNKEKEEKLGWVNPTDPVNPAAGAWTTDGNNIAPKDSERIDISDGLSATYTGPVQQLLNKDFNDWSLSGRTPDNYEVMSLGGSVERSTDKHAGTYAAKLTISALYSAGVYISPLIVNDATVTAGSLETLQARIYAKRLTGSPNVSVLYECENGEDTYNYNFTGASAGTWTVTAEMPTADNFETLTATDSYTQLTATQVTVPEGYTYGVAYILGSSANSGDTMVIDDYESLVEGTDQAVNGDFENWTDVVGPDSWLTGTINDDGAGIITEETTIVNTGTSSVKMADDGDSPKSYVGQLFTGTAGDEISFSYYARGASGNASVVRSSMIFLNNTVDEADEIFNYTTGAWEAYSDPEDLDADNQRYLLVTISEVFTQDSYSEIPAPTSGKILAVVWMESSGEDGDVMYVDTASMIFVEAGTNEVQSVDSEGKTTFPSEVSGKDATLDNSFLTLGQFKEQSGGLLATVEVDMTAIAATELYRNELGKRVVPLRVVQVCIAEADYSNTATWSMGTNDADYNNYITSGSVVTPYTAGYFQQYEIASVSAVTSMEPGDSLEINVTTGATATTQTVVFRVYGIVIDNIGE